MAPIGYVCGQDTEGNARVKCEGLERDVIIKGSYVYDFRSGHKIDYKVTRHGKRVDFSDKGSWNWVGGNGSIPKRKPQRPDIAFILYDEGTRDALVLGHFDDYLFSKYRDGIGSLDGLRCVRLNVPYDTLVRLSNRPIIAGKFQSRDGRQASVLPFAFSNGANPYREELERIVVEQIRKVRASPVSNT